ncbi:MAG: 2-oxo acid dehydrogenase subunit E2 [Bdellovibrionales bacterium]|nr:2-oxo acid dehydrogenase subunit E2 [Bdellovibrionales bacterium]
MPSPVFVPRLNANEDVLRLTDILVQSGDKISQGDPIVTLEGGKASLDVEAEQGGYVLGLSVEKGKELSVGSLLCWIGATAEEQIPQKVAPSPHPSTPAGETPSRKATMKARALARKLGVDIESVSPSSGDRISADDVIRFSERGGVANGARQPREQVSAQTISGYESREFAADERVMASTVRWQRDHAVATYLEVEYDQAPWRAYAKKVQEEHGVLFDPLLGLLAHKVAQVVAKTPGANSFVEGNTVYTADQVHLGFTIEARGTLYMGVVRNASELSLQEFLKSLAELQMDAFRGKLSAESSSGMTVSFSSLAKQGVKRHVPILPPRTSLIIAHSALPSREDGTEPAVLGCTYDHQLLHGATVAGVLNHIVEL